ncbi:hypothetical protein BLD25_03605 [Candidatus Gracilibacteria bacterium GN02-872]|nr:hypothetical protein BLD25_03605 [Candidatus Gracilibacteria bacterium GN02-872]RKW22901.1 MAG: hypothetical protein D8B46_04410 [Candidatus Gracilibacteria bacterium]
MKKNIFIIAILVFGLTNNAIGANESGPKSFSTKGGYKLYQEQVKQFCSEYKKTDKTNEIIMVMDESKYFKDLEGNKPAGLKPGMDLELAKKEYEKAMDSIYGCAIYSTYYRELKTIKEDLIKTNPKLNPKLRPKIEAKMKEIEAKIKALDGNCRIKANKNNLVKNAVLRQTTYETCKYNYYLEYLKEYNQKVGNLIDTKGKKSVGILDITNELSNKLNAIDSEIERIYNTYPIVFQAYNDYENNITSHILLDLLQQDFKVFRLGLHKTLNPLNQVIYKISNAMRR